MDWNFEIRHLSVWTGLSAVHDLDLDPTASPFDDDEPPPPWFELGVLLETDRGTFTLHVELLDDWLRHRPYLNPSTGYHEPLLGVEGPTPDLYVAPWEEPSVLVAAEFFDWPLVHQLLHSPPALRRRILWPQQFAHAEMAVLLELEKQYTADEAVRHAVDVLEERFGLPLHIGVQEAREAAGLVRAATFLRQPEMLWKVRGDVFSPGGRRAFTGCWMTPEPF